MTWKPLPGRFERQPEPLSRSLERLAKGLGASGAASLGAVFSRWEEVVGASVAAHARPLSLRDGVLVVAVEEPGWATQLRYLGAQIVTRCDEVAGAGAVTRVEVRVRPRQGPG